MTRGGLLREARDFAHLGPTAVEVLNAMTDGKHDPDDLARALDAVRQLPPVRTLADILSDPDALKPPVAVVPRMAWENRVTLLVMREKGGKSTTASAAAAPVTRGAYHFGERCQAGDVLWLNFEEFTGDLATRLHTFGADPARVHIVDFLEDPLRDFDTLVRMIEPRLVVVDTLAALAEMAPQPPEPGSSAGWTPIMSALARPIRDSGAGLLLLHHARKSDGEYRDSTAIGAGVDMILTVSEDQDSGSRKVKTRGRWSLPDYTYSLVGDRLQLGAGELAPEARVLAFVINNPGCSTRAVRDGAGLRAAEAGEAIQQLVRAKSVENRGDERGRRLYAVGVVPEVVPGFSANPSKNGISGSGRKALRDKGGTTPEPPEGTTQTHTGSHPQTGGERGGNHPPLTSNDFRCAGGCGREVGSRDVTCVACANGGER